MEVSELSAELTLTPVTKAIRMYLREVNRVVRQRYSYAEGMPYVIDVLKTLLSYMREDQYAWTEELDHTQLERALAAADAKLTGLLDEQQFAELEAVKTEMREMVSVYTANLTPTAVKVQRLAMLATLGYDGHSSVPSARAKFLEIYRVRDQYVLEPTNETLAKFVTLAEEFVTDPTLNEILDYKGRDEKDIAIVKSLATDLRSTLV